MAYRIGIEIGSEHTTWATISRDERGAERIDSGTVASVAGVADGTLLVGVEEPDTGRLQETARGFVDRLGDSEAIVLGGTPYGVEALVGGLIASVVRTASDRLGTAPGAVVIVHADSLDQYRVGLLTEAARVAGVPLADVVIVSRSEALAATPQSAVPNGLEAVTGASSLGWIRRPAPAVGAAGIGATEVGIAATGAVIGAAGTAAVATGLGDGVATANAAMAPPAGPAGTPLAPPTPAGPAGTPLASPAGPAGTPLTPSAGPIGTSMPAPVAGPGGTPLAPTTGGSSAVTGALRPRRLPIILGATVAAVAVVAVVVVAVNDDDPPSTAPVASSVTESNDSTPAATEAVDTTGAAPVTASAAASRCVQGQWTMRNESFAEFFGSMMASAGGAIAATGVSGSVAIDVAEDGTWTLTYDNWTLTASMPDVGGEMSVTIDGVDVSNGTFDDDGTFSFSGVSVGTTITESATVNGVVVPIPPIDRSSQVVGGTGTFTCEGDVVTLMVPASGGSFIMDRTG